MTIPLPVEVSDLDIAFPAHALDIMPPMEKIPDEFKHDHSPWLDLQRTWFYRGLSGEYFSYVPAEVDGERLDPKKILRHLQVVQGSFAPSHEHKEATVAYLASLWMEAAVYGPPDCELKDLKALGALPIDAWIDYFEGRVGD